MKSFVIFLIFISTYLFAGSNSIREEIGFCVSPEVAEFIRIKIESAKIQTEPFPHLIIENFLPESLYERGLERWPEHSAFKQQTYSRQFLWTNFGCIKNSSLDELSQSFWQTFGEVVINYFTKPFIINKFKPFLATKFSGMEQKIDKIMPNVDFWNNRQDGLIMYPSEYELAPHIDECNVFVQMVLYFPDDNEHEELGTVFYSGDPSCSLANKTQFNSNLSLVKKVPYRKNTLVVFLQSPLSWHSAQAHSYPGQNYFRKLYLASISLSPQSIQKIYGDQAPFSTLDLYAYEYLLSILKD